ncbi:gp2 protein [Mycobacteroides abscessus subsp. abscessus]|nr:gp2 protein [Mycobacteroides abscessus subsp. abscessus]
MGQGRCVEGFAARETYRRVVNDALRRAKLNRPITVTTWPPGGGGDAMARSAALLQGLETGTTRIAGYLPGLEQSAVTWQAGQHQPDSLAAVVVAHDAGQFELPHCWPESRQEIGGATADAAYLRTSGLSFLLPGRYLGALFGPFANHHNTRNYGVNVLAQIFQMIADSVTVRGSHCRS